MKMLIIALLTIFFSSSCKTGQIKPYELCTYSYQFNKCRCRWYDLENLKATTESYDRDISYCDDITGFRATDWSQEILPKLQYLRRKYRDLQRRCR